MTYYIEFKDSPIGLVSDKNIDRFSFICSIFKVFSMMQLTIHDSLKSYFNQVKCGMPVSFVLIDDNGNSYENRMRVLSFTKTPGSRAHLTDSISMTLISSIYFDKSFGTAVHDGSVGFIYNKIMNSFFKDTVVSYKGTSTDDLDRRRYQTEEKTLDFMTRIMKYSIKEKFPVYLYSDAKGVLNFKGVSEMMNEVPEYTAVSLENSAANELAVKSSVTPQIEMWGFESLYDGRTANSKINNLFCVSNFRFQKKVVESYLFDASKVTNNQIFERAPGKTNFYGWNLSPDDAFAIAARDSFERTIKNCSFRAIFRGLDAEHLELGKTINVKLPYDSSAKNSLGEDSNLGEGRYLITDLEYNIKDSGVFTIATMAQIAC